jgi:hypothetical protein
MIENRFCNGTRLGTRDAAVNSLELSVASTVQSPVTTPSPNNVKTFFGPVPQKKGQPVCVSYEKPVNNSHWDIYNLAGQKISAADYGNDASPCWDSSNVAPGIYMIRSSLSFSDGSSKNVWNKIIIQP